MDYREVLNDLVEINNDRITGYEKAAGQSNDSELRILFDEMARQSRRLVTELRKAVSEGGKEPADGTTTKGKIYRAWMDVKATFGGDDKKSLLATCEFGEDAAQKAYKHALEDTKEMPAEIVSLVQEQKASLKESHDKIKRMRDAQPA